MFKNLRAIQTFPAIPYAKFYLPTITTFGTKINLRLTYDLTYLNTSNSNNSWLHTFRKFIVNPRFYCKNNTADIGSLDGIWKILQIHQGDNHTIVPVIMLNIQILSKHLQTCLLPSRRCRRLLFALIENSILVRLQLQEENFAIDEPNPSGMVVKVN